MGSKYKLKEVETDTKKGSEYSVAEGVEEKIAPDTASGETLSEKEAMSKDVKYPKIPDGEKLHETSKKNTGDETLEMLFYSMNKH